MCENFRVYLEVVLLDHQLWECSTFQDNSRLFSEVDVVTDPLLAMSKCSCRRLIFGHLVYAKCANYCLMMVLISIFLITNHVEHLFMFFKLCVPFPVKQQ